MSSTLIVRLPNWLGDTVMAVPLLRSLRRGLPASRVVAAGPWAPVLDAQGLADVLVPYPRPWRGRLRATIPLRRLGADVAVVLPHSLEAALAARAWGARRRVGFATDGRRWLLTDPLPLPVPRRHQADEYLLLLGPLGVEVVEREPRLVPPAPGGHARTRVRALLAARRAGRPVVGVHLGAEWGPSKLWPVDRVADFCREAAEDGMTPVLLGPPEAAAAAAAVVERAPAASLVGQDHPGLLPALLAELDGLVAGDTGVAHLAAALGTPVVALFGPTDPALTAPRGPARVVRHPVPCSPCFHRRCPIDHPCLRELDAARVRQALAGLGISR